MLWATLVSTGVGEAAQSGVRELESFALTLSRDYEAVEAALTYEWSQGQVEGQITVRN